MRQILSGGIAYPHFVQIVLSAALTFSRLIFGFRGIFRLGTWTVLSDPTSRPSIFKILTARISAMYSGY
jgi:hypothetical protein